MNQESPKMDKNSLSYVTLKFERLFQALCALPSLQQGQLLTSALNSAHQASNILQIEQKQERTTGNGVSDELLSLHDHQLLDIQSVNDQMYPISVTTGTHPTYGSSNDSFIKKTKNTSQEPNITSTGSLQLPYPSYSNSSTNSINVCDNDPKEEKQAQKYATTTNFRESKATDRSGNIRTSIHREESFSVPKLGPKVSLPHSSTNPPHDCENALKEVKQAQKSTRTTNFRNSEAADRSGTVRTLIHPKEFSSAPNLESKVPIQGWEEKGELSDIIQQNENCSHLLHNDSSVPLTQSRSLLSPDQPQTTRTPYDMIMDSKTQV
jgi:hypothetical protein